MDNGTTAAFVAFLRAKGLNLEEATVDASSLDDLLEEYFATYRKTGGDDIKLTTLRARRYSLARVIKDLCDFDITNRFQFPKSYEIMKGKSKDLKIKGLADIQHFNAFRGVSG